MTCYCTPSMIEQAKTTKPEFAAELADELKQYASYGACKPIEDCRCFMALKERSLNPDILPS
jgi:hypothetical protein